jgi:hypothetical protein
MRDKQAQDEWSITCPGAASIWQPDNSNYGPVRRSTRIAHKRRRTIAEGASSCVPAMAHASLRASSRNIRRMRLPGCASATAFSLSPSPLKSCLGSFVLIGMVRPCLPSREAERLIEAGSAESSASSCRIGRDAVDLDVGPREDRLGEFRLLVGVEPLRTAIALTIRNTCDAIGIVTNDPITQRLPVHACRLRRRRPHSRQRIGDRQHATPARPWPATQAPRATDPF